MSTGGEGVILGPGEGRTISTMGSTLAFKAVSENSGGAYALAEYVAEAGFSGPAPHLHLEMEEAFYVLDGTLHIQLGEEAVQAPAGSFVLVPRGTVHTFANPLTTPSKFLLITSPGGFEHYYEELAAFIAEPESFTPEAVEGLAEKYKFRVVSPG